MPGDVASMATEMTPYVSAAMAAYGGAVLAKVRDDTADPAVILGRRLIQKVFGHHGEHVRLPTPLADLAANPADRDALAACRLMIREALTADPVLADEIRSMLAAAGAVTPRPAGYITLVRRVVPVAYRGAAAQPGGETCRQTSHRPVTAPVPPRRTRCGPPTRTATRSWTCSATPPPRAA
jgi:hypothetical protein